MIEYPNIGKEFSVLSRYSIDFVRELKPNQGLYQAKFFGIYNS